jgi:hypothetical protein
MLNTKLHNALRRAIAAGKLKGKEVKIVNVNQKRTGNYVPNPINTKRLRFKTSNAGETYWVCCPWCGDTRYRLSISYQWNEYDPILNSKNLGLLHCFNEECQGKPGFIEHMTNMLTGLFSRNDKQLPAIASKEVQEDTKVTPPGLTTKVSELSVDHPAYKFLTSRNLDPKLLGEFFDVSFCYLSNYAYANNRIIFPVIIDKETIGWQARYINVHGGGDVAGLYFCKSCRVHAKHATKPKACDRCQSDMIEPVPKYWTSPGFKKGHALMNYDNARSWCENSPFVIIVEGPVDAIHIGSPAGSCMPGPAVALFGHTLSPQQKLLIGEAWRGKVVCVMLDEDAKKDAESIRQDLQSSVGAFKAVLNITLPPGKDPADCSHSLLWQLINSEADKVGIKLV